MCVCVCACVYVVKVWSETERSESRDDAPGETSNYDDAPGETSNYTKTTYINRELQIKAVSAV